MAARPWSTIAQLLSANLRLARVEKSNVTLADLKEEMKGHAVESFHFPGSALSYSYRRTADMNDGGTRGILLNLSQSSGVSSSALSLI